MKNLKSDYARTDTAREAARRRRTFNMRDVLGMRRVAVVHDMPDPKPNGAPSDERSELFKRQEAEMRKVFGLSAEWSMDDLQPEKPKPAPSQS